jgi:hypothetical protein
MAKPIPVPVKGKGGSLLYTRWQVNSIIEGKDAERNQVLESLAACQAERDEAITVARNCRKYMYQIGGDVGEWLDKKYPMPPVLDPAVIAADAESGAPEADPVEV